MQVAGGLHLEKTTAVATPSVNIIRTLKDIAARDGVKGCFRGLGATLCTVPFFWGIYFPLYEDLKQRLTALRGENGDTANVSSGVHMASAVLAGSVADFVCNPMFVVRTRMQTEALHMFENGVVEGHRTMGIGETVKSLYREGGGVMVFWKGLTASLLGLGHVAIQFPVYEWLKSMARNRNAGKESPLDLFLASGLSKIVASTLTYPHEVVRSRMMDSRTKLSLRETFQSIIMTEGWAGLYSGLPVTLIRVVPNCCITFVTYELLLRWARESVVPS